MPKSNFNFVKSINRSQGVSLHQLSKFQQQLDCQRLNTVHEKQIFKKQVKLSKQNQLDIVKTIDKIQKQAIMLTNKCQEQKTKHEQLEILVKKLEGLLYQQKLQKYEDIINNKQPDQYEQQKKIMREHQKKLQNIVQKLNSSSYQITKKIDQIRMLRSQRSVFSVLFDKLEREYYDVQFYYKQLAIERSLIQNIYKKSVDKWNQLQSTSQSQQKHMYQEDIYDQNYRSEQISQQNRQQAAIQSSRIQIQTNNNSRIQRSKVLPIRKQIHRSQNQFQQRQKNFLKSKKKVLDIYNQLGIRDIKQLRDISDNQTFNNEDLFYEAQQLYDQIFEVQASIKNLREEGQNRQTNGDKKISLRSVHLKIYAADYQKQTQKVREQVLSFKSMLQRFVCFNSSSSSRINKKSTLKMHKRQGTQESDKYSYAQSEEVQSKRFKKPLQNENYHTFSQNYEQIRQMMTMLNEKLAVSRQKKDKLQEKQALQQRTKRQKNRSFIKSSNPKSFGRFNIKQSKQSHYNKVQTEQSEFKKQQVKQF